MTCATGDGAKAGCRASTSFFSASGFLFYSCTSTIVFFFFFFFLLFFRLFSSFLFFLLLPLLLLALSFRCGCKCALLEVLFERLQRADVSIACLRVFDTQCCIRSPGPAKPPPGPAARRVLLNPTRRADDCMCSDRMRHRGQHLATSIHFAGVPPGVHRCLADLDVPVLLLFSV